MILSVTCGYAPAPGNGPLGKTAWSEILTAGGATINVAPAPGRFGQPYFDIRTGKACLLAVAAAVPCEASFRFLPAGTRLVLPATPGERVYWHDTLLGEVVVWHRGAGLVRRLDGEDTFAVKAASHNGPKLGVGNIVTFSTARDVDRREWAVDMKPLSVEQIEVLRCLG